MTLDRDKLREDTLHAIAMVTAFDSEPGDQKPLAGQLAAEYAAEHGDDGPSRIANGLIQLSVMLLAKIELDTGKSFNETLAWAAEYANSWRNET